MRIGIKLIFGFMSTVIIIAVSGIFAYNSMGKIHKGAAMMHQHAQEIEMIGKIQTLLAQVVMPANDYIITGDTKYRGEFQKVSTQLQEQIKGLERLELTQEERQFLDEVRVNFDKVKEKANQIFDIDIQTVNPHAARLMEEMDYQYAFPAIEKAEGLHAASRKHMEKEARSAGKLYQELNAATIAFVGLGAIIAVLLGILISRGISRTLRKLSQAAMVAAEGNLTQTIEVKNKDESGDLAKAFNTMMLNLKEILSIVLGTAERVSYLSQQLSTTTSTINTTAEEVTTAVQHITKGMEVQAEKTEETVRTMEKMQALVELVAKSAGTLSEASIQSNQAANLGGEAAHEAVEKMRKIYDSVSLSADVVKKLGERSLEIDKIINIITDIADQTNLLALNAAIEAARAGEQGRGFAVVAEEVRKLAEGSAKAADEISKLIREIRAETSSAVRSMNEASREVTEGRDVIQHAGTALGEIIKTVENTAVMVQQIRDAAEEQTVGTKQVVRAVNEIASTAQSSAAATQEVSASAEEMTQSMEELASSSRQLADMASGLKELVARFKTGGAG